MSTDTDALVPVAWIEHEWAWTGARRLHFERREPTVRDEVVNPVWTPLYGPDTIERLTRERDEAVAAIREFLEFQSAAEGPTIHEWARWRRVADAATTKAPT